MKNLLMCLVFVFAMFVASEVSATNRFLGQNGCSSSFRGSASFHGNGLSFSQQRALARRRASVRSFGLGLGHAFFGPRIIGFDRFGNPIYGF